MKKDIKMTKEIREKFIELCSKESVDDWCEDRKFNKDFIRSLGIGKCTLNVFTELVSRFGAEPVNKAGMMTSKGQSKYHGRVVIPFSSDYYCARHMTDGGKYKNLFPKGLSKRPFIITSGIERDVYVTEGETDALRLAQEIENINVFSVGGAKGKKIIDQLIKYYIDKQCNKIIVAYDNDDAGKEGFETVFNEISKHRLYHKIKEKGIYKLIFDERFKDIDEYFVDGCKKEDLITEFHKIEQTVTPHSIYSSTLLPIDNYYDNAKKFYEFNPYFYDKVGIFWFWNKNECKYELYDDIDVMNLYDRILGFKGQTVNSKIKVQTLEAMKRYGREKQPPEAPKKWIQFKDKAYSLNSGNIYDVQPNYFFTNPIPWDMGTSDETPIIDKLFTEWVGEQHKTDLYELIAYCCYSDYPIQLIFCLYGTGRNGKSQFLKLLGNFIGKSNICSTELDDLIDSRFEKFKLYKKLVCTMGETNFGVMSKTSLLKKLVGGDMIGYEKKNKDPFDDVNYAKIMIASNSLPTSDDTSDGFMRRWHIIDFPNEFPEGKDIICSIPAQEYSNLARKCTKTLKNLLEKGHFANQGSINDRKKRYMMVSNPLPIFIEECCDVSEEHYIKYNELYIAYVHFLNVNKKRKVKKKEFRGAIEDEGYFIDRTSKVIGYTENGYKNLESNNWIDGLRLKTDWKDKCKKCKNVSNPIRIPICEVLSENTYIFTLSTFQGDIFDDVYQEVQEKGEAVTQKMCERFNEKHPELGESGFDMFLDKKFESGEYFETKPGKIMRSK